MKFPVETDCRKTLQNGVIRIKKRIYFFGFVLILLGGTVCAALFAGCVPHKGGTATLLARDIRFKKIAIVPFQTVVPGNPAERVVRCPLSGATFRSCISRGAPEEKLEEHLIGGLTVTEGCVVVPPPEVRGIYQRISTGSTEVAPLTVLKKVGEAVGADGVVAGYLFCYRERKGFDYAAERPASVAFCVHLIRVADGVTVWKGIFDKTQSSLMENILDIVPFLRGGGRWMTANELSREGMRDLLKDFPEMKGEEK